MYLSLERGGEEITGTDGDTEGQRALGGPAGVILLDGVAAVDAGASQEVGADAGARAFRCDQDHVDVLGRDHTGLVAVDD